MAMTVAGLQSKIIAQMTSLLAEWDNPLDDHRLTLDFDYYKSRFALAIATAVISEITTNAKAIGNDSNGDTHNLDIV